MLDEIMPELNFDDPEVMRQAQEELKQQKAKEYKDYVASLSQKPAGYSQIDNLLTPERDLSDDVVNAVAKSQQVNPNSAAIQDQVALRRILSAGSGGSKIPIFMPGGVQLNTYDPAERKRMDDWAKEPYEQALKQNELNNDNLRRLTQAQNILDLQGARKSQNLKRVEDAQRMADELRMKKDAINPNSYVSKSAVEIFQKELASKSDNYMQSDHKTLKRVVPQLDAMIADASGKSKEEIERMAKSAQSVIDAAEKEAGLDVNKQLGKARNFIMLKNSDETHRSNEEKEKDRDADRAAREARAAHALGKALGTGTDAQTRKALNEITIPHTVVSRVDALKNSIANSPDKVGWMKRIETAISTPFGQQSDEDAKLIADLAFIYQPHRKKNFGVPSPGDNSIVAQYFPALKNNPQAFMAQLQSFRDDNNYQVYNGLSDLVTTFKQDIGISPDEITPDNAYGIYGKIKGNISKATKGGAAERIDPSEVNKNAEAQSAIDWLEKNKSQAGQPKYEAFKRIAKSKGYVK